MKVSALLVLFLTSNGPLHRSDLLAASDAPLAAKSGDDATGDDEQLPKPSRSKALRITKSGKHEIADDGDTRWIIFRDFKTIEKTAAIVHIGWPTAATAHAAIEPAKMADHAPKRFSKFKLAVALPPSGEEYLVVAMDRDDANAVAQFYKADALDPAIRYLTPKASVVPSAEIPKK